MGSSWKRRKHGRGAAQQRARSVSAPAGTRGCKAALWRMSLLDGLQQHAYFLLHSSRPEPTAGRQLRHTVYANHSSKSSGRTAAVLAPASSRNTASYAATYMPYTPVFAHVTQLRSPTRNPDRCEFLQDARASVRTSHMRCCWLCRVRCAATDWAAPAAVGAVGAALSAASSAEGEAAAGRPPQACMHAAIMLSR